MTHNVQLLKINAGTLAEREEVVRVLATNSSAGMSLISYIKGSSVNTRWVSSHRIYDRDSGGEVTRIACHGRKTASLKIEQEIR